MIELKPIKIPILEWEQMEEKIKEVFRKKIYLPLLRELYQNASALIKNASDPLVEALRSGKVTFYRGKFSGSFNASISKRLRELGATWLRSQKCYSIPLKDLPYDIRGAISSSEEIFLRKVKIIDQKIAAIVPEELASEIKMDHLFDRSLWKVQRSFEDSVKAITVPPQLSESSAENLRKLWRDNINLSIKGIAEEILPKLRKDIQDNVYRGNRYGDMVQTLQDSYGLSASRAKYVARNETNLLMAKFKQERLSEVGVYRYKWVCVKGTPDHQVRPIHRELTERSTKGEIFDFRKPPIAEASGERYNPHERNNCRCSAVPVFNKETK